MQFEILFLIFYEVDDNEKLWIMGCCCCILYVYVCVCFLLKVWKTNRNKSRNQHGREGGEVVGMYKHDGFPKFSVCYRIIYKEVNFNFLWPC